MMMQIDCGDCNKHLATYMSGDEADKARADKIANAHSCKAAITANRRLNPPQHGGAPRRSV